MIINASTNRKESNWKQNVPQAYQNKHSYNVLDIWYDDEQFHHCGRTIKQRKVKQILLSIFILSGTQWKQHWEHDEIFYSLL